MADYQLTSTEMVIRTADNAHIPDDPTNHDRQDYEQWLANGGVPDPYEPPEGEPPVPSTEDQVLYDHENRLRALEGEPPLTLGDFLNMRADNGSV